MPTKMIKETDFPNNHIVVVCSVFNNNGKQTTLSAVGALINGMLVLTCAHIIKAKL